MGKRNHIVITGTGRTGTSFLMMLLTRLGLDTGFTMDSLDQHIDKNGRAGLEGNIRLDDAPYIIKSPHLSNYVEEVLAHPDIVLDHVFIPIRNIEEATQSRVHVSKTAVKSKSIFKRIFSSRRGHAGGMVKTSSPQKQELLLLKTLSHLLVELAASFVPVTFIQYPLLTQDARYLYDKMKPLLQEVSFESFQEAYMETVNPKLVNQFSKKK